MKTREKHKEKLKEIADFAFTYGMKNVNIDFSKINHPNQFSENESKLFIEKVHEGFKFAQDLIIKEVLYYQRELLELKQKIKEARREKKKKQEKEFNQIQKVVEHRIFTITHIADTIAWQMIGGQIHIARRMHIGERTIKSLDNNNLEHTISVSNQINKDLSTFALISDITSFVQIGDLLIKKGELVGMMELKEGKVNKQIEDFFSELKNEKKTIEDINLESKFDKKTVRQIKRVARQKERLERAEEVMNTDEGIDPASGNPIHIATPGMKTKYYHDILSKMAESLSEKDWAYELIEDCLHIGMYKNEAITMAPFIIEQLVKKDTENYRIIDWMSIVNNLSHPIFLKPLHANFIIDILVGEVKVIMAINFDRLVELFNTIGLETRWLSNKETMKQKQRKIIDGIVEINGKGIMAKLKDNTEVMLYYGTISKMFYDNIYPSSIATSLLTMNRRNQEKE